MNPVSGIRHVTAIASDPQHNLDFYGGALGLRLVKRTVNFDDPQTRPQRVSRDAEARPAGRTQTRKEATHDDRKRSEDGADRSGCHHAALGLRKQ